MGGYGSGRWSWKPKKTQVEECHKWRIAGLKECLTPGFLGTTRWMIGERETGSIGFCVLGNENPEALKVSYVIGTSSSNPQNFDYLVYLTTTPLPWGGVRYWFVCPLQRCYRRVGCLYLPPGGNYFGCRHCYDLSYESKQDGYSEKSLFSRLAAGMQDEYPGINWKDVHDILDHKHPRHLAIISAEHNLTMMEEYDRYEGYLTADELCAQSGLAPDNLKELKAARLLNPDSDDERYRPKLAGWGKKLAYLLNQGWKLEEIKRWAVGRFKTTNPKQWPPNRTDWQ